ncbi:MAG: two-component system cell cycle response regulator [Desulforhopalus sp.]
MNGFDRYVFYSALNVGLNESFMRITRKVFTDLGLFMLAFGFAIGFVFPFFVTILGVPKEYTLTYPFFASCISAGLISGLINFGLARKIVGDRLSTLSRVGQQMTNLARVMRERTKQNPEDSDISSEFTEDICGKTDCHIVVDSDDVFGESAHAFNLLADTLRQTISTERAARSFTYMLTTCLDLEPLAEKALQQIIIYSGSEGGLFAVEHQGTLQVVSSHGIGKSDEVVQSEYVAEVLRTGKPKVMTIPEAEDVVVDHIVGHHHAKYILVTPVLYKGVSLGVFVLASPTEYSDEILHRLEILGTGLGLALNNSLTHGRMRMLAILDPLTEIYNRGFGVKRLHEEYTRSVRADSPLGVIIFDIDDFKLVNDTYGHMVGDRVLVSVVKMSRSMLREGDILIRYGGEEFMVVLPGASLEDVRQVGERIRRAIQDMTVMEGDISIKVTVSLGGVSHPELNVSHQDVLVRHADVSLYYAKNSGKNKIELDRTVSELPVEM